ncbi:MAG: TlpA disulfide reductase family protein [Myxococcota bacterium]
MHSRPWLWGALVAVASACTEPVPTPDDPSDPSEPPVVEPDPEPEPEPEPEPPTPCSEDPDAIRGVDANMCTPGFELPTADGTPLNLGDYEGQVVLLEFVTMWCGVCRQSAPGLQAYAVERTDDPVAVVTLIHEDVFGGAPNTDDIEAWTTQFEITHPVVADVASEAKTSWTRGGTMPTPMTYVIDQYGYIRFFAGGNGTIEEFDNAIADLLE